MPRFTNAKNHSPTGLRMDAAFVLDFNPIILSASSPANTTVQTAVALPCNLKIVSVTVLQAATPTNSLTGLNIVAGTGGEAGTGTANTAAGNGTQLFTADTGQTPTNTQWSVSTFTVPQTLVDVVWPITLPLTVRMTGTTITGTYYVQMLCKAYDMNLTKPLYNPSTGALQI